MTPVPVSVSPRRLTSGFVYFAVGITFFVRAAAAQQTGAITGQVTDPSGAFVAAADVSTKLSGTDKASKSTTDEAGKFSFSGLTPGLYELVVQHAGFDDAVKSIQVAAGATVDQTMSLSLGARSDSASVDAKLSAVPTENPTAQTITTVVQDDFKNTPALSVTDIFDLSPGVTTTQGNGPRDISVSIRGSNERQTFAVRNIQISEDGFPVTQPDGTGRTDLTDPHAYSGVDVVQGPSSALYGNYGSGGAVNFHTRQTEGIEVGTDFGSFGFKNDYAAFGASGDQYRFSGFLSNVRGSQYTDHTQYNTFTANILASYSVTPKDRITIKFIDNELQTNLSIRLSLTQYQTNPWQLGCGSLAAAGCASVSLYANGFNGAKIALSADQAGLGRNDRRTIMGSRWEHDLTPNTLLRTQFVWDNRDINQPTGATSAVGTYPSYNVITDLIRHGTLFGLQSTSYIAASFNFQQSKSITYNVAPGGEATLGGVASNVYGTTWDGGFRARQEMVLAPRWTATVGAGVERTELKAREGVDSYPTNATPTIVYIPAKRYYTNFAPDAGLRFQALQKLALHTHLGTGYGTPQISNLYVTPQGVNGNNTQLKTQKNIGLDVGADWTPGPWLRLNATGFQEWFHDELVTQSPGVNLQSYTFNAPASSHKGVNALADLRPLYPVLPGLRFRASYLFDRQTYTNYYETLSGGNFSTTFNRAGNLIPGVTPQFLNIRMVYDQPKGALRGVGGYLEEDIRAAFFLDNANLLRSPGSNTLNLNLHYNPSADHGLLSRLNFYLEVKNVTSKAYVASASNITDSLNTTTGAENGVATLATSGVFYSGPPRSFYGGVRIRLRQ